MSESDVSEFVRVCSLAELIESTPLGIDIGDVAVCVVKIGDEIFAIQDECSHAEVPLSEGDIEDCTVECWLHGSRFDLRTGKPSGPPAIESVPIYPTRIDGDDVFVSVASEES